MHSIAAQSRIGASAGRPVDPYLLLAKADNFSAYGRVKPTRVPIVAEFGSVGDAVKFRTCKPLAKAPKDRVASFIRCGPIVSCVVSSKWLDFLHLVPGLLRFDIALPFAGARMRPRIKLADVSANEEEVKVEEAFFEFDNTRSGDETTNEQLDAEKSKALLAVIDSGCPFAHAAFRRDGKTKNPTTAIRAIWDQDPAPDFEKFGNSSRVPYGRVLGNTAMNAAIKAHQKHTETDERACYRSVGYHELSGATSHGAAMLGLLCHGIGSAFTRDEVTNDVLFVQLPRQLLSIPSRAALSRSILDGVAWVMNQRAMNERTVVVSISYASSLTAHDSSSFLAKGLQVIIQAAKTMGVTLSVVFAAGNDYEESLHAELCTKSPQVRWRHAPGNEVPSFAELWLEPETVGGVLDKKEVTVLTPSGKTVSLRLSSSPSVEFSDDKTLALVDGCWTANGVSRLVLLRLAPTAATGDYLVTLPTGAKGSIYVSHRRGSAGYAFRASRSRLVDVTKAQKVVTGLGTLNGYACFPSAVLVGAYVNSFPTLGNPPILSKVPTNESSSGPARAPREKDCPDFSAIASQSRSAPGVRVIGNFSSGVSRLGGTSVAAPQAGRKLAATTRKTGVCTSRLGETIAP